MHGNFTGLGLGINPFIPRALGYALADYTTSVPR